MTDYARLLEPRAITEARLIDCSVPEPDAGVGEIAWTSGEDTAIGELRIRASTHRVYKDAKGGVSTVAPELDPTRWKDEGPTNRWAWADYYESTVTTGASPLTLRVRPGVFGSIVFRALDTGSVRVQCWDAPGGALYHDQTYATDDYLTGDLMWEFYFGEPRQRTYLLIDNLPLHPAAEVLITMTSLAGAAAAGVGTVAFGLWETLGLPEFVFDADLIDRSRIEEEPVTGRMRIKRGVPAVNVSGTCVLDDVQASRVAEVIARYLGVPVAISISAAARYDYLNTFGLVSATVSAINPKQARVRLRTRGIT
ncbi:hypothetical protein [Comamonas flocculans]|uniref:Uncharacterized protein n=1 Tax=Comamonas flocculans TaxID=2597701 RepID=A0A5B8RXC9_9BURK|nr:hypothetical protein [Comamonas flocculans]QEA14279.1 hypothetical protein FOZ74_15260 [Comamonas flocculans]